VIFPVPNEGFSLDLDSTVFQRSGNQQGAKRGYNPARPGRNSHHPLLAFLAEAPLVLHAWLRSGNTGSAGGATAFLTEALALMPAHWKLRAVRADSEFLAIRERIRENKSAVGRRLIDVDGYTFRVFVTKRQGDGAELWRDYNQRACCEQHIEELKNDLQADGFCMKDFHATESSFLSVCFTCNLLSLYQHASSPEQRKAGYKRPVTLRAEVFIGGAVLGNRSRTPVFYIAESWGGLDKHKPLLDNILQWPGAVFRIRELTRTTDTSVKLVFKKV
jgi:hypothetical protein